MASADFLLGVVKEPEFRGIERVRVVEDDGALATYWRIIAEVRGERVEGEPSQELFQACMLGLHGIVNNRGLSG